jgi:DNA (cytosine-5)-methyltransferase 1
MDNVAKPMSNRMDRPLGIDLFAGAGGLSLGFEQAGFDIAAAVEIDPIHAAVHKFNFPGCAVLVRSIMDVTGDDLRKAGGFGSRQVDVVFGGPPCQGFSLIGHRALDDKRNILVREFVRIVDELKANYFVFENVKGLTVGHHKVFLNELIEAFRDIDYVVRLPWEVLDAADYGVPQHRERLILMGARKGLPLPEYPPASCSPRDGRRVGELPFGPSCSDALGDLPDAEAFEELVDTDEVRTAEWSEPSAYAREMRGLSNNSWHFGHPREWKPWLLTSSVRTQHSEISQRRFRETVPGTVEPISRFFRLSPIGLSNTLRAGTDGARGAFTSPRPIHYAYSRCVTVREMARLHGFPDWFRLHETKWHGARQIGNAVPPPLARAVATQIMGALGIMPVRGEKALSLGDPSLLRFVMSQAAEHFGVDAPNSKRDRKSGAKKRKQHEIEAILEAERERSVV